MLHVPARRLICGTHRCGKTTLLVEAAASSLDGGLDAGRLLALSVNRQAVRGLRAALHTRTGLELLTADVRRRATALLEQFPASAGLPAGWSSSDIISALDRRVLMRRAWAQSAGSLYDKYSARPGALDWLAGIFDLFAEWIGTTDPQLLAGPVPADAALAELWAAYCSYLELCRGFELLAFQEVVPRAVDVLRDPQVRARVLPDLLLLDDLDLFRPSELLFARALITPTTAVVASSGTLPSAHNPEPGLAYLAAWCAALELAYEYPVAQDAVSTPDHVYAGCPSPQHEADAIARAIATSFGPDSRFADYAIICFDPDLLPILRHTLPQWNIAVEGMDTRDAYAPALAPLILAGMRLIAGTSMLPAELVECLRHPGLGLDPADAHALAAALGAGLSSTDPLTLLERWSRDERAAGSRGRLRQIAHLTSALRDAAISPSAKLQRWLGALDCAAATNTALAAGIEPWEASADADLVERWLGFLRRSERLRAAWDEPLSDMDAVEVLAGSQPLVEPIARPLSGAVQLWQPDQLGGCTARVVWLAGLHEHALPQRSTPLAWVRPEVLAGLDWLPGFVPLLQDDRAARWEHGWRMLQRAAGRAEQRLGLSWSQTDQRGRRRLRSPLLDLWRHEAAGSVEVSSSALLQGGLANRPEQGPPLHICETEPVVDGAVTTADVFTTSPSALEDFLICPRRYFYARVLNLYDVVSSPRQALGQVVHAALHELKVTGATVASAAALVEQYWPAGPPRFGTRLREAAFRRLAEQAVAQVAAFDAEYGTGEYVGGEVSFRWQIMPGVELRGTIDRIDRGDDGLVVLDYKLGSNSPSVAALLDTFAPPSEQAQMADWRPSDLQLPLYALAIEHGAVLEAQVEPGDQVTAVGLVYPLQLYTARGKPAAAGRRMLRIVDHLPGCDACAQPTGRKRPDGLLCRDQLGRIADRARAAIGEMRAGTITPDPIDGSRTCASCAFRAICPAPQA